MNTNYLHSPIELAAYIDDNCEFMFDGSPQEQSVRFTKSAGGLDVYSSTRHNNIVMLLEEIDHYFNQPAGWDNESDAKTDEHCLTLAKKFVILLSEHHSIPQFSAATGEEVSLCWEHGDVYFIINFFRNNTLSYLYDNGTELLRGDSIYFDGSKINCIIIAILDNYLKG